MAVKEIETDVLIIGAGLAGEFAGIKAREAGVEKVTILSKGKAGKDSICTFGAGVYMMDCFPEDDKVQILKHYTYTEAFGSGLYDPEWLNVHLDEAYGRMVEMDQWGVEWEKTPDGKFERMRQRHGALKCMFHGPQLMEAMTKKTKSSGVNVIGHIMATGLLTEGGKPGGRVVGAVGFDNRMFS